MIVLIIGPLKVLTYSMIATVLAAGSGTLFYGLTHVPKLPVVVNLPPLPEIKVDPLECYRFTGETEDNILLFQTTTGDVLLTFLETINGYRDIVLKLYLDPWVDLISRYLDK